MPPKAAPQQSYPAPRRFPAGTFQPSQQPVSQGGIQTQQFRQQPTRTQAKIAPRPPQGQQQAQPQQPPWQGQQQQQQQQQDTQYQQPEAPAQEQTANGEDGYYYYYQMPDGTWGYAPAGYGQDYSPVDEGASAGQQPAGYNEPGYGEGTGYTVAQGEDGQYYYYYYDTDGTGQDGTQQQQQQQQQMPQQQPMPQQQMGGTPACQQQPAFTPTTAQALTPGAGPAMPSGGGQPYTPPENYKEVAKWKGSQKWSGHMCCVCGKSLGHCCGATFGPWCYVGTQRKKLLDGNWHNYVCCAGLCGRTMCSCCDNGAFAMAMEALFCLPCAIHANRFMLMKRYGLKRITCDNIASGVSCLCLPMKCCDKPGWSRTTCDWVYFFAYPCLIAQVEVDLKRVQSPLFQGMR